MHVCGIIAEYNPFHSGHAYQIAQAKKQTGCDFLVIVTSGDFVQRGAPALLDKYTRARMALAAGADLVLMLPVYASTASAEGFARAGVAALHTTGLADTISFGCESPAICAPHYQTLARLLEEACSQPTLKAALTQHTSAGLPYAQARIAAISDCFDSQFEQSLLDLELLKNPNNLLAFEYLRAIAHISAKLQPYPIQRLGSYHDTDQRCAPSPEAKQAATFVSASVCRRLLLDDAALHLKHLAQQAQLPATSAALLRAYHTQYAFLSEADCSQALHYALLTQKAQGFADFLDCGGDLSARIVRMLAQYENFSQFCDLLKNKSVTRARIARALTHILLGLPAQMPAPLIRADGTLPYLRVLGFRKSAAKLLHAMKKSAAAPLITRPAQANRLLTANGMRYFSQDLLASELYRSSVLHKSRQCFADDYRRKLAVWNDSDTTMEETNMRI